MALPGSGGERRYYRENALGSQVALTGSGGAQLSRTDYDAFGVEQTLVAGPKGMFKFGGKSGYVCDL